jgi:hypothetical protein
MLKPTKYSIADSNIALLGSELEKKARLEASQHEEAWHVAGKDEGLQIWRIEKFKIVPWAHDQYGRFYDGDSYICLKTTKVKDVLMWDIHYWIGAYSTQDEYGTAAYKTVELDDFLGGGPVQYREVQGFESKKFQSLFPHGIQYLSGGIETGFKHVGPEKYETRLLHIKGRRYPRVEQVPLDRDSLNSGDVFILDAGLKIYVFQGAKSSIAERTRGLNIAQNLDESRRGAPEVYQVREADSSNEHYAAFWAQIAGGEGPIKSAEEGGADEASDSVEVGEHKLFRLSDASGELKIDLAHTGEVKRSMLESSDVWIVDIGEQVFVWVGKDSSSAEKRYALKYGTDYLMHARRPLTLPIVKLVEGRENEDFFNYVKLK